MRRLIKKFGDLKISEEATEEMRRVMGELGLKIAKEATDNARREGRRTILERDIRAAHNKVKESKDKEK
jgi:histone H3/H4